MQRTLLTRAVHDLDIARYCLYSGDEEHIQSAATMVQQAIEKAIKFSLEKYGVDYKKIRHVDRLVYSLPSNQTILDEEDIQYLEDIMDTLYRWESEPLYVTNYLASRSKVEKAYRFAVKLCNTVECVFKDFGDEQGVPSKPTLSELNLF